MEYETVLDVVKVNKKKLKIRTFKVVDGDNEDEQTVEAPKAKKKNPPKWIRSQFPLQVGIDEFEYYFIPNELVKMDPSKFLPLAYDLIVLHLEDGKIIRGWWDGNKWVSRRLRNRKVINWEREYYVYD